MNEFHSSSFSLLPVFISALVSFDALLFCIIKPSYVNPPSPTNKNSSRTDIIFAFTALLHCMIAFVGSFLVIQHQGMDLFAENTPEQIALLQFTVSYFLVDTVTGLIWNVNDHLMVMHHIAVLSGGIYVIWKGQYGSFTLAGLFLAESSNSFFQLRTVFQYRDEYQNLSFFSGILFCIFFLCAR